jgi:hypothetical protein
VRGGVFISAAAGDVYQIRSCIQKQREQHVSKCHDDIVLQFFKWHFMPTVWLLCSDMIYSFYAQMLLLGYNSGGSNALDDETVWLLCSIVVGTQFRCLYNALADNTSMLFFAPRLEALLPRKLGLATLFVKPL